jgi:chemotaxis protein CheD
MLKVAGDGLQIHTILGSCVALCLFDQKLSLGGMNHFMLPFWNGKGLASPKYGNIAIQRLVDMMLEKGSQKRNLIAKVFGGANVLDFSGQDVHIGTRNVTLAFDMMEDMAIKVAAQSTGGERGRKIVFDTATGMVQQRYIDRIKMHRMPVPEARQKLS